MKCSENTDYSARTATITVTPGAGTATPPSWTLTQAGATPPTPPEEKITFIVSSTWDFAAWGVLGGNYKRTLSFVDYAGYEYGKIEGIGDSMCSATIDINSDVIKTKEIFIWPSVSAGITPSGDEPFDIKLVCKSNLLDYIEEKHFDWYYSEIAPYRDDIPEITTWLRAILDKGGTSFNITLDIEYS